MVDNCVPCIRSRPLHVPASAVVARWCNTKKEGEPNDMTPDLDDYEGILAAVQAYIDGWNERDPNKFRRAFLEGARMLYIDEAGSLTNVLLDDQQFEELAKHEGPNVELRVLSVHQMGDAASVALAWGPEWFDFHNLLRIDGEWRITNKTASHKSR